MPSLESYRRINSVASTNGLLRKKNSDAILEQTWYEDIATRTAYFYDMYHDSEPLTLKNMKPYNDVLKIPIDIKFIEHSHQTYNKDQVTFHIMFKPSYVCDVPYYNEVFGDRYNAIHPVGLYCDIPDEKGIYNRWLVVNIADYYGTQFPTFEVLPCDKIIQYIYQGIKYQIPVVLRSQNSYNYVLHMRNHVSKVL